MVTELLLTTRVGDRNKGIFCLVLLQCRITINKSSSGRLDLDSDSFWDSFASHQLALFDDGELTELATPSNRRKQLMQMDGNCLQEWSQRVFRYQQQARTNVLEKQTALFDASPARHGPDSVDPFSLSLQSLSFWRFPKDSSGDACLYFVIDNTLPLLLYIGETSRSNQRWKGVHDCKRYIENYQSLHYQHQIRTAVCIAF